VRGRWDWLLGAGLLAAFAALTAALAAGWLLDLDVAVRDWSDGHRPTPAYALTRAANYLGQGGVLTIVATGLAVALLGRARTVRPLLVVAATFVLTTVVVLPLKWWTHRAAPSSTVVDAERLFHPSLPAGEYALSYPAGHLVVAVVWYPVIAMLIDSLLRATGRPEMRPGLRTAIRVAPTAILLVTTTYLSFHWLTDGPAGILVGLLLLLLIARTPWDSVPLPHRLRDWAGPIP
jgi:hypothetical protein